MGFYKLFFEDLWGFISSFYTEFCIKVFRYSLAQFHRISLQGFYQLSFMEFYVGFYQLSFIGFLYEILLIQFVLLEISFAVMKTEIMAIHTLSRDQQIQIKISTNLKYSSLCYIHIKDKPQYQVIVQQTILTQFILQKSLNNSLII